MEIGEVTPETVVGVCAGRARWHEVDGRRLRTAFVKDILIDGADVSRVGVAGDEHVYAGHGGPDMAVLVYSLDHYAHWRDVGLQLREAGAFGENLTVTGLTEIDVCIGDVYRAGSVTLQVAQPRHPCRKISTIYGMATLMSQVQRTGFTGYLMRVLDEGRVTPGDRIELIERQDHGVTVAEATRVLYVDRQDDEAARRLMSAAGLASSALRSLEERLGI